ncbi:MAG: hypothetical protein PHS15_01805 [Clostridiaceae bacterium]|nr:hypothetical protein [Clostridiaceae bacterium]
MGNYNLKNILLGIGIGLVFSSMINISIGSKELTVEEIKKEAVRHNLIVLSNEEILNNQSPADDPSPAPTTTNAAAKPAQTTPSPASETPVSEEKITVNIKSGMSSESIAELLKEKGLIKDTKAFLKRLGEVGKENILKVGSFEIPKNATHDEIISILTK